MGKRSQRSSPYPSYTIEHCVDLVSRIYTNFGSGNYFAKREEIAKVLGISSGHLQTQVSSAGQYELLDLKQGEGYKPSKLFVSIHRPISEEAKEESYIQIFKSPPLYSALIEQFDGEILPSEIPLSNILLHHHSISEKASERAASIFIENARSLGFLDSSNVLSISTKFNIDDIIKEQENIEEESPENFTSDTIVEKGTSNNEISVFNRKNAFEDAAIETRGGNDSIPFNIPLKGKRTAQIIVPEDVKTTDFDFIINFINLMKQQFE